MPSVDAGDPTAAGSEAACASIIRVLPRDPSELARFFYSHPHVEHVLSWLLFTLASRVLDAAPLTDGTGADALDVLLRLCAHGDRALLQRVCGRGHLWDVCVLGSVYDGVDVRPIMTALWPQSNLAKWTIDLATSSILHEIDNFAFLPWAHALRHMRRAIRLTYSLLAVLGGGSSSRGSDRVATAACHINVDCASSLANLAQALATAYNDVLSARRIPSDEVSSSATPWPTAWLATKVDILAASDACVLLTPKESSGLVLERLDTLAKEVPDAVALVDASLLADLQSAAPTCASIVGASPTPFPGAAWAAVRSVLRVPRVNPALVDAVVDVLSYMDRPSVERRLRRPRYKNMSAEAIIEAFLDDPDGLQDIEADHEPDLPPPPSKSTSSLSASSGAPLPPDVKAAIIARAESQDAFQEEWDLDAPLTPAQHAERILLQTYQMDASVFARTKAARASSARAHLRDALAHLGSWGDDQIEGWGVMFDRDPRRHERLTRVKSIVAPNVNVGTERSWAPDKLKGGRTPKPASGPSASQRGGRGGSGSSRGGGRGAKGGR